MTSKCSIQPGSTAPDIQHIKTVLAMLFGALIWCSVLFLNSGRQLLGHKYTSLISGRNNFTLHPEIPIHHFQQQLKSGKLGLALRQSGYYFQQSKRSGTFRS